MSDLLLILNQILSVFLKNHNFHNFLARCYGNEWTFWKTNATFNTYFLALYSNTINSFKSVTMRFQDFLVLSENCS